MTSRTSSSSRCRLSSKRIGWRGASALRRLFYGAATALTVFGAALPGNAQTLGTPAAPQYLLVDRDRLFAETLYGQRISTTFEERSNALAAETRALETQLEAEEKALAEARTTLSPEEFRAKADAFDARVTELRSERSLAQNTYVKTLELAQATFYTQVGTILAELLRDRGAVAILDRRMVLLAANSIDITDAAIARIDERLGDGTSLGEGQDAAAPQIPDTADTVGSGDGTETGGGLLSPPDGAQATGSP